MTTSTGTSIVGLQRLGAFNANGDAWQLQIAAVPVQSRLMRLGTVLHCRAIANSRFPVVKVHKLFGHGLAPGSVDLTTHTGTEIWVNWFYAGINWTFIRSFT